MSWIRETAADLVYKGIEAIVLGLQSANVIGEEFDPPPIESEQAAVMTAEKVIRNHMESVPGMEIFYYCRGCRRHSPYAYEVCPHCRSQSWDRYICVPYPEELP